MIQFGIIGYPLEHSASADLFNRMFAETGYDARYDEYAFAEEQQVEAFLREGDFAGVNVTYPWKETVIRYLDKLEATAAAVGAVNVIDNRNGELTGYNTDTAGFAAAFDKICKENGLLSSEIKALVLGTGGAAKAIAYVLGQRQTEFSLVSRSRTDCLLYTQLNGEIIKSHRLIINCTPLGMYPDVESLPPLPYETLGEEHILFDSIYNPEETLFLRRGREQGAKTYNGRYMLEMQARAAWEIWKKQDEGANNICPALTKPRFKESK